MIAHNRLSPHYFLAAHAWELSAVHSPPHELQWKPACSQIMRLHNIDIVLSFETRTRDSCFVLNFCDLKGELNDLLL